MTYLSNCYWNEFINYFDRLFYELKYVIRNIKEKKTWKVFYDIWNSLIFHAKHLKNNEWRNDVYKMRSLWRESSCFNEAIFENPGSNLGTHIDMKVFFCNHQFFTNLHYLWIWILCCYLYHFRGRSYIT